MEPPPIPRSAAKRLAWPAVVIGLCQAVQACTLFPWLMMAGLSFMAFDAPGSTKMWQPWAFVAAIWSYPLWLVLAAAVSWMLYARKRYIAAIAIAVILAIPMPALLLAMMAGV